MNDQTTALQPDYQPLKQHLQQWFLLVVFFHRSFCSVWNVVLSSDPLLVAQNKEKERGATNGQCQKPAATVAVTGLTAPHSVPTVT